MYDHPHLTAMFHRKLSIIDTERNTIVREIENAHDREIHHISLPQPSVYVPHSSSSTQGYNMFATASTDNSIALWDLRSSRVICRYYDHVNRREAIGCSISPCLRYLATGSEDNTCRIVDIRSGCRQIASLKGHHDVVMDAQWHPTKPKLATCSLDGGIHMFTDADFIG